MENKSTLKIIKNRHDFINIRNHGQRTYPNSWLIFNYKPNDLDTFRLGYTVPKAVGNAVLRNKLKRWSREVFRDLNKKGFKSKIDINIVFKSKNKIFYENLEYNEFNKSVKKSLDKIKLKNDRSF